MRENCPEVPVPIEKGTEKRPFFGTLFLMIERGSQVQVQAANISLLLPIEKGTKKRPFFGTLF
jgi:hypothetical protein